VASWAWSTSTKLLHPCRPDVRMGGICSPFFASETGPLRLGLLWCSSVQHATLILIDSSLRSSIYVYYCQWVTLITWICALSHRWARCGLWILCPMISYLSRAARSCVPQFLGVERCFNSLTSCRRPSTFSANTWAQQVGLTLLDVLLHIVYRIPIVIY